MKKNATKTNLIIGFTMLFSIILFFPAIAQEITEGKFGIEWTGFVKTDVMFDTRRTDALREGHFLLYPLPESKDRNGEDIYAKPNFNILSIQTRVAGKIAAPDALGAKASGYIEGEFFGTSEGDVNGFRVRHAYLDLDWGTTSLRIGQFWHPMFVTDCYPNVLSFNTGAPFQPFIRSPQIRLTQKLGFLKVIAVASTQRDFQNNGPDGYTSQYLRNSAVPNFHLQLQANFNNILLGAAGDYKMLTPRLVTSRLVKTDQTIGGFSAMGFAKIVMDLFSIKLQGIYGQDLADMLMIGGFGIKSRDSATGKETYSNISCLSAWTDIAYGKDVELGLFVGYSQNLGADDNIFDNPGEQTVWGRGISIEKLMRVAPRILINIGKTRLAAEVEYTSAAYGSIKKADKAKIVDPVEVANLRVLLGFYVFF